MHRYPRLGVEERVMRAFVVSGSVMLHGEQIGQSEPDLAAEQFGERLRRIADFFLVLEQVFAESGVQLGVAADLELLVVQSNRRKVFGESFVEPSRHRRIVVIQKKGGTAEDFVAPDFLFK